MNRNESMDKKEISYSLPARLFLASRNK